MVNYVYFYITKYKKSFCLLTILMVVSSIINIILPYIFGNFIDYIVNEGNFSIMFQYAGIIVVIYIIKIIISYFYSLEYGVINRKLSFEICEKAVLHLQKIPENKKLRKDGIYLIHRIQMDSAVLSEFIIRRITSLLINVLNIILVLTILFKVNKWIFFITLIISPIYVLLYYLFKKKLYESNLKIKENENEYFAILCEQLDNLKFIKVNVLYEYLKSKLNHMFYILLGNIKQNIKVNFCFENAASILSQVTNIILIVIGGVQIYYKKLSIGMFTILNNYFDTLLQNITSLLQFTSYFQQVCVSYQRIKEIDDLDEEENGTLRLNHINNILLENIKVSYNNIEIVSNVNFEFKKGNAYIIKGSNGCGKSTLAYLICGLINEYNGCVKVNGIDIRHLDMYDFRRTHVSFMEQNACILKESVLRNIGLNNYYINNYEQLFSLVKEKSIDSIICDFDIYKNKILNEEISGGEKQRVILARNLIKDCEILILDEPENALDNKSINSLVKIINTVKKKKIVILLTHDERFDSIADQIIDLSNAKLS